MLVRLYDLPDIAPYLARQVEAGIDIRRPLAAEKNIVVSWVLQHFGSAWASECDVSFSNRPVSCYIAVDTAIQDIVGFGCYDTAYKNFFGPTGVRVDYRGRGIGAALLLACLHAMCAQGYAYAVIGAAGPTDFYAKIVGAVAIEGSEPGIYRGALWHRMTLPFQLEE